LLTHTAGIPAYEATPHFQAHQWQTIRPEDILAAVAQSDLDFTPGAQHRYSNAGYALLALVVERASGKGYEAFLHERFFAPLGMRDTGVVLPEAKRARAAVGYSYFGGVRGAFAARPRFQDPDLTTAFGAGSIYSTLNDLFVWDRALASDAVLSRASKERLFAPRLNDYACGWMVNTKDGKTSHWHNGALVPLGFTSAMARVPSTGTFVVFLSNRDMPFIDADLDTTIETLARGDMPKPRVFVDAATRAKYAGTYDLGPLRVDITDVGGTLFLQGEGQPKNQLVFRGGGEFTIFGAPIHVAFHCDADQPCTFTLRQGGQTSEAKKR
jgi:CubicO group peptidase (beta-lactamase class C family)